MLATLSLEYTVISEREDKQDTWTDEREYAVIADNELSLTVHPFLTNHQDILDLGGEICIPADRDSLSILNLLDLLPEKHDLTAEDLSTGWNWELRIYHYVYISH